MQYLIYKTTNIINGKVYIGLHETEDVQDGYLGSGIFLKKAIRKYGAENFKKEILFVFDNKEDMIAKEKELVNEEFVKRQDTYNMSMGGFGLSTLTQDRKEKAVKKIKKSLSKIDLRERSKKRIATILSRDPLAFKKMGATSAMKQRENYKNGYINPNQNLSDIHIYNKLGEKVHTCKRIDLPALCKKHGLPERVLIKSIQQKGTPLYEKQKPRHKKYAAYTGWCAAYETDY